MKATSPVPKKASLRGKRDDTKYLKKKHLSTARQNAFIASKLLNLDSLPLDNMPEIDENGHMILDPNNPIHRMWMED